MVLSQDGYYIDLEKSTSDTKFCKHKDCPIKETCFIADIFNGLGITKSCKYLDKNTGECNFKYN